MGMHQCVAPGLLPSTRWPPQVTHPQADKGQGRRLCGAIPLSLVNHRLDLALKKL
jgi:hypothetical protein